MDPRTWAQDVLRCHLCETPVPPLSCDICDIHLCKACVGEHLLDESTEHKVVPFKKRGSITKCKIHSSKYCDLYCEQCDIPICFHCISSGEHEQHKKIEILENFESKNAVLKKDLEELEKTIFPNYQRIVSNILDQKADLNKNSQKLTTAIDKHGEELHREIDTIIKNMKLDLKIIDSKHMDVLTKKENEITNTITEMTQRIADLKKLMDSKDVSLIFAYKSRNAEFKRSPPKFKVSLPAFTSHKINKEEIYKQFGFLSTSSNKKKEHNCLNDLSETKLSPLERSIIDKPRVIKRIFTETHLKQSVSCLYDEHIWVSGNDNAIRLYSLSGKQVKSIKTTSGKKPEDLAVTRSGDLIYADKDDRTVNLEKNGLIQTAIRLKGWKPRGICCTSSGDLLVAMDSDDKKEAKVVRYADFTEKQTVQYDDKGEPLYSPDGYKYISENRNLDICVSESVVVVVNQAGNRRFTYSGRPFHTKKPFSPFGIATDSQGRILIADFNSTWIHILDQEGLFLRFIDNCHLSGLYGLCLDSSDNLFVTVLTTNVVKKIQYYK